MAASCGGKVFGAVKYDLVPTDQFATRVPDEARELRRGIWISESGLFMNSGFNSYTIVDMDAGVAVRVVSSRNGGHSPGIGYEADETANSQQPGWPSWRMAVSLSPDQITEIACLANAIWSHRPRWMIDYQRARAAYDVAYRSMEQAFKRRNDAVHRCERYRVNRDYLRCMETLPPPPSLPQPPDLPSIEIPDPDLFTQATHVYKELVLRDDEDSWEVGGIGDFAGKSEALIVAVRKLFR